MVCRFQGIHEVDFKAILDGAATIRNVTSERQYGQVILEDPTAGHSKLWLWSVAPFATDNDEVDEDAESIALYDHDDLEIFSSRYPATQIDCR